MFRRGDNNELTKIRTLKIVFSRTIWPISTKLDTKHPWVKETQFFCQIKGHFYSHKEIRIFSLNQCNGIIIAQMCLLIDLSLR